MTCAARSVRTRAPRPRGQDTRSILDGAEAGLPQPPPGVAPADDHVGVLVVEVGGEYHAEQRRARPQRPRLHDVGRRGQGVDPHAQVEGARPLAKLSRRRHQVAGQQRVLDDAHDRLVVLRRDDVARDRHQQLRLGAGLGALGDVEVLRGG